MRYIEHLSRTAVWSYRIAILSVLVFVGAFVWHRFFGLPTPFALKVLGGAVAGAVVSLVLAVAALASIWKEGHLGAGRASAAMFLSTLVLAVPLWSLPGLLRLPRLYEITTDTAAPPAFDRVAKIRQGQANPVHYEASFATLQSSAYPDIKPLQIQRSLIDVYPAVRDIVKALNWKIIDEQAPEATRSGHIEAMDRTLLFGFTDDIAIRVTGSAKMAKVDIRSSSRFGQHDLGRNADRIRRFLGEVKHRLAELERLDRMERVMASKQAVEKNNSKPSPPKVTRK
ncbi:MAG: DUF1499 domain-containing protein [Rhodomicrobium sp.]